VLAAAVVVAAVLLVTGRNRTRAEGEWRQSVAPAYEQALLARQLLVTGTPQLDDPEHWASVRAQSDRAARDLDGASRSAPDDETRLAASSAAESLRALAFALESDRLLRQGSVAPTGDQLAQADASRRARTDELERALARLRAHVATAPG
jgi:hypothetical protein